MSRLAWVSLVMGLLVIAGRAPLVVCPAWARRQILAFPRSVWAARLLTAVDLVWSAWLLYRFPFGWFESRPWLGFALVPITFLLIVLYMNELLAVRALGGLLLLAANVILETAQWHESPARLIMVALAYLIVIWGMVLVISPYRFRKTAEYWVTEDRRCRIAGWIGIGVGAILVGLGWRVY